MNICAKCKRRFLVWSEYHQHVTEVNCIKLLPINTSGRTKAQIVAAWEEQHKGALIG
jgi:hypothetical protein